MIRIIITSILLLQLQSLIAQHLPDTIPFTLSGPKVLLQGRLNDTSQVRIEFDLGAGTQAVNRQSCERLGLHFDDKVIMNNTEGINEVRKSNSNQLSIGHLQWSDLPLAEVGNMLPQEDLIVGNGLFWNKVIELDYDLNILIVRDHLPEKAKDYASQAIIYEQFRPKMKVSFTHNGETYTWWTLFDTGRDGTMLIGEDFTGTDGNWGKLKELMMLNGKKIVRLDAEIGGVKFKDIVTNAADPENPKGRCTLLGNQVLSQFNVILDNKEQKIYLKANSRMGMGYSDFKRYEAEMKGR
ncbi:retropepsin-like aspartic protease [Chitinophaga sancti]|nr:retropepsin-like aspartic protease [Chitinophaga sancti]WQD65517.1 retropepsin-like aspartic protease [Chitinophaga sancti]WQG88860.1 retropepsin-like aspartic protease [Chitinophaga sancti]